MTSVEERIEEEVAGRPLEEVDELILDECECTQLTAITDEYVNLEKLSAVACGLTTLKGFPSLKNLKKLDLSANQLTDAELTYLSGCTSLTNLVLGGNPIKDLAGLEALKGHKSLRKLDLTNTELSETGDYREKVFELLDQILYLDGLDRDNQEDEVDSEIDEDGIDAEDDEDEASEDENSEDDDEGGPGGDDEDDDDEDGEDDDEEAGDHERGVKRKHEDEEDV